MSDKRDRWSEFLSTPIEAVAARVIGQQWVGRKFGSYEVVAPLGAGGMGEVYLAHDTRLGRDVAVKVLPTSVLADSERHARFAREARVLAALNHPNIAAIHGVEEVEGTAVLVLELADGETLADRIARGPIPWREALPIARQICAALEAAHEKAIIHRDLKPSNIAVTKTGAVKVLDFGLAKSLGPAADASRSPTIPLGTADGVLLGTASYMSPEQARGHPVDKQTDIWAFGCVLYEMLTGRRAFVGETPSDRLAAILEREPDWSALPQPISTSARRVLRRCLEKDAMRRLHDIADARIELEDEPRASDVPQHRDPRFSRSVTAAFAAAIAAVIAATTVLLFTRPAPPSSAVTRTIVSVAPADQLRSSGVVENLGEGRPSRTAMALSPDGRSVVFSGIAGGRQQLFVRDLDRLVGVPIPGTDGGSNPFFSPDGRWVGFYADGALKRVAPHGDAGPTTICEVTAQVFGASWGTNDSIVFSRGNGGLLQVSAAGGTPHELTHAEGSISHRLPQLLPGNRAVLFTATRFGFPRWDQTEIVVQSLESGARKTIAEGADARYVAGFVVYVRAGDVFAMPFDAARLEVNGAPVNVLPRVMQAAYMPNSNNDSGAGQFSVAASGALVYVPGGVFPDLQRSLVWVDPTGRTELLAAPVRPYYAPRLSPDGTRVLAFTSGQDRNVWMYDIARHTLTRVTDGRNAYGVWMRNGDQIAYRSTDHGIMVKPVDDGGPGAPMFSTEPGWPVAASPDGRAVIAERGQGPLWVLPLDGGAPRPLTKTRSAHADFSPDGRWVAYASVDSGRDEVYVEPYPGPGPRRQVSVEGGSSPAWNANGRELFFENRPADAREAVDHLRIMAVPVTAGSTFTAGTPRMLFERRSPLTALGVREYDVSGDGRFLFVQDIDRPAIKVTEMILVQNWAEELKRLVPSR